jgi:hypothetical protein
MDRLIKMLLECLLEVMHQTYSSEKCKNTDEMSRSAEGDASPA